MGEGWKVIKVMHFGIHYSKELPSHWLVTKEKCHRLKWWIFLFLKSLGNMMNISMPIITICFLKDKFEFTSFLIKSSLYKYLLHDTNYGSN
jgi:hypothetical protein